MILKKFFETQSVTTNTEILIDGKSDNTISPEHSHSGSCLLYIVLTINLFYEIF